jgi:ribonuclease Z
MIEVIFLGVGAAVPMRNATNTSYLVRIGNERILIDCGPAILQQLDAVNISPAEITHVFFTHRHGDHALGFPMLMLWYELNQNAGVSTPIFIASEHTFEALDGLWGLAYGRVAGVAEDAPRIVLPQDCPGSARIHPAIMLRTWPMTHSEFAPVIGLRIETRNQFGNHAVAFTGDTSPNENILPLAKEADLLVHESAYCAALNPEFGDGIYGHSTARTAGRNARAAGAKKLALVHIDAMYEGREPALLEEACDAFGGPVCVPIAGVSMTVGEA